MLAPLLRPDALDGQAVVAAGACAAACAQAGAALVEPHAGRVDTLVADTRAAFADGGLAGLRAAFDETWEAVLEVAAPHWLQAGSGGRLVLLAPAPHAGEHAGAAAAGLESLARTLAVEWARFGVRATVVVPGPRTTEGELGALAAYLASAGGAYVSGCRLDLR